MTVLLRLLEVWPEQVCAGLRCRRELPPRLQEAMLRHPLPRIRGVLAVHRQVDPEVRAQILVDSEWRVRFRAFGRRGQRPLSDDALVQLLTEFEDQPQHFRASREELINELFFATGYDRRVMRLAAVNPRPGVRLFAARSLSFLDESSLQALLADPVGEVRAAAAESVAERQRVMEPADLPGQHCHAFWWVLQRPLSRGLIDQVLASGDVEALHWVAANPTTPPDVVETLLRHPDIEVRRRVATRADLSGEQLLRLAGDASVAVRTAVSTHRGLTEQQRASIDIDVTTAPGDGHYGPREECGCLARYAADETVPPLTDALEWAGSVNPLLRRRAARNRELPADVVAVLADDPDLGVRVLLAQHHPGAPPALLRRCFLEYHGCGRERLSALPHFPAEGLAEFSGHPDPAVRRLVALDPHAAPELVDRLCADPDMAVRQAMASCPRLPLGRVVALLDDPDLAEHAAANPALPIERMWRIIEDSDE